MRLEVWWLCLCVRLNDPFHHCVPGRLRPAPVIIFPLIIIASISPTNSVTAVSPRVTTCLLQERGACEQCGALSSAQRSPSTALTLAADRTGHWPGLGWQLCKIINCDENVLGNIHSNSCLSPHLSPPLGLWKWEGTSNVCSVQNMHIHP